MGSRHQIKSLTGQLEKDVLQDLWKEIQRIKSGSEAEKFLDNFLTNDEKNLILRRLAAMRLIRQGKQYKEIVKLLKISKITISKTKDIMAGRGYGRNPERKRKYGSSYSIVTNKTKEKKMFRKYKGAESFV